MFSPSGAPTPCPAPEGGEVLAAGRARELAEKNRNQLQALERISVLYPIKGTLRRASPALDSALNAYSTAAPDCPASLVAEGGWQPFPHETT